jgi:guanosine-3',5'-bis(diphosphate) 3'-pyrophosphohydrolase
METLDSDIQMYLAAVKLGTEAHAQQRYGDAPYTVHLAHVENALVRFGFTDPHLLAAAWLHDAVEDNTGVSLHEINLKVGLIVALLVEAVTDCDGETREERKRESYRWMRGRPEAIPVKLADRIANLEASRLTNSDKLAMYQKEYGEFRKQLYHASLTIGSTNIRVRAMWSYLDDLLASALSGNGSATQDSPSSST